MHEVICFVVVVDVFCWPVSVGSLDEESHDKHSSGTRFFYRHYLHYPQTKNMHLNTYLPSGKGDGGMVSCEKVGDASWKI